MRIFLSALLLLVTAGTASAQAGKAPWEEYDKRIKASEKVAPLGNNAFGDEVSLSNGALSFSALDVSLPGNSGLPVAFGRNYSVRDRRYYQSDAMLADWDVQLPSISGVFASDWINGSGGTTRCSSQTGPQLPPGGYLLDDFFQGINLDIPGVGGGELLIANSGGVMANALPTASGGGWTWVAGNQIYVACLSTIKNGTGEGFLAITPDGTKYWFDWMAQYFEPPLRRPTPIQGLSGEIPTNRRKNVLYATRIEDRFGNWVTIDYSNAWNAPGRLKAGTSTPAIKSNDGRQLTVTYNTNGHLATVSDGTRTWSYAYGTTTSGRRTLTTVTLPDSSAWAINFSAFTNAEIQYTEVFAPGETYRTCYMLETPLNYTAQPVGTITHPAGATGTFTVDIREHGRSNVPLNCGNVTSTNDVNDDANLWPISYHAFTLKSKQVSGPALTTATWNYSYTPGMSLYRFPGVTFANPVCKPWNSSMGIPYYNCFQPPCEITTCTGTSKTLVQGPNNEWTRYIHGNNFLYDEGKLLQVETGKGDPNNSATIVRTTFNTYDLSLVDQAYPKQYGTSLQSNRAGFQAEFHRPQLSRSIQQQGVEFVWEADVLDVYARPTRELRYSTLGDSKIDETTYLDSRPKWAMGQVATTKSTNGTTGTGAVYTSRTVYDGTSLLPTQFYTQGTTASNGLLVQTLTYNADGTIASAKDGNNNTITLTDWYRGVPRTITYPGATTRKATVSAAGFITSVTDELNFTTTYGYDALGRMTSVTYPAGDTPAWTATSITYTKVAASELGIPAGHWRQSVTRGNYRKDVYFDALWRPVIEREWDNAAATTTQRFRGWKYDHEGRVSFEGYPRATATSIASFGTTGVATTYDALGRPVQIAKATELGSANTDFVYDANFVTSVRNPRSYWTDTTYQVFDEPSTDYPESIIAANGTAEKQITAIVRDHLGKPLQVVRSGQYAGVDKIATRDYVYDIQQRLCKRVEPETGATIIDYDGAQNISWSAEGTTLTSLTCDRASVSASERVARSYDTRNRLTLINYPDATADIATTYYADGAVNTTSTGGVTLTYTYNRRRLLTSEQLQHGSVNWQIGYAYSALGDRATVTYPDGHQVSFAPNALGQATQAGTYATAVSYFPNGSVKGFTYGNGVVHSLTQNLRQLPLQSRDALGATAVLDDTYSYDLNGNVGNISDAVAGPSESRTMSYDAVDRLVGVTAGPLYGGNASFAYDPLDNLMEFNQSGRQQRYVYDSKWRLQYLKTPAGVTTNTLSYDVRGNTLSRNPGDYFTFDRANRMLTATAGSSSYSYDGLGRRVLQTTSAGSQYYFYSRDGQLLFADSRVNAKKYNYVYLSGTLVAKRTVPDAAPVEIFYQHTDALGSPVAITDYQGSVLRRERMTSYGEPVDGTWTDGPGYTGHQNDAATELVYMQQRYYEPSIGRFLSVDPVTSDMNSGWNFNRYNYAANNPHKFKDPDGRIIETVWDAGNVVVGLISAYNNFSNGDVGAGWVDVAGVAIDATATVIPFVPGGASTAIKAGRAADHVADTVSETRRQALGKAKDANGVPRSAQPDAVIKPGTDAGNAAGLDSRNVRQYEYTNSSGDKISIREDKPASYPDGGSQPAHFNAGRSGDGKLEQHHYIDEKKLR